MIDSPDLKTNIAVFKVTAGVPVLKAKLVLLKVTRIKVKVTSSSLVSKVTLTK